MPLTVERPGEGFSENPIDAPRETTAEPAFSAATSCLVGTSGSAFDVCGAHSGTSSFAYKLACQPP